MTWIHYQLALMPNPGTILHIGAGLCSELSDYQHIEPDRIILVEPNPESINALRQKAAEYDNVTILQAAVAAEAGRGRLHRFNFPELDSLREPTGLCQLLPGLQEIGQTEVSTISPAQLTRRLSLDDSTNNWLVLEAPGEEAVILQELNRTGALQNFSRLIVRTGAEPYYEGGACAQRLHELTESLGFFVEATPDKEDPDWPRYHLRLDRMALECERLQTELAQTRQKFEQTEQESAASAEEIEKLNARIADFTKDQEKLEAARQKLEQAEKERAATIEKLETALAEKTEAASKLQSQLEQLQSRLSTAESELKSTQQENDDLQQACRKLEQDNARKEELIDEEFLKAESQLELIKDLVFRDKKA